MFCLPMYTWCGCGLAKKRAHIHEYVAVKNQQDPDPARAGLEPGVYRPIEVSMCGEKIDRCDVRLALEQGRSPSIMARTVPWWGGRQRRVVWSCWRFTGG